MGRHTHMLTAYSKQAEKNRIDKILQKSKSEVSVNAGGTSGYTVKSGENAGKILKHLSVKHHNK
jgi:hypothetical protein